MSSSPISQLALINFLSSEKEARKFNAKLLQRQTALETQVEQLTHALKDLTDGRRSSSATLSPHSVDHGTPNFGSQPSVGTPSSNGRDVDHAGDAGGLLRLEKDGESIYIGAGGSSWALQTVSLKLL